jgi:hypothetical protein
MAEPKPEVVDPHPSSSPYNFPAELPLRIYGDRFMAEPRKPKVEVVFASDGIEVIRLYGTSWSDQEPALALYRQLAPFIRQIHVWLRERLIGSSSGVHNKKTQCSTPVMKQESLSPLRAPMQWTGRCSLNTNRQPIPNQTRDQSGGHSTDGNGPEASPPARQ